MISSEHIITPQGLERITSQAGKWMSQKDMNHHRQANTGMIDELTVIRCYCYYYCYASAHNLDRDA